MTTLYASRVAATMRALLEALQGAEFDAEVEVTCGLPLDAPPRERVQVLPRCDSQALQERQTFGQGQRQETFSLVVDVVSAMEHPDALTAIDRVVEMAAVVETAVRLNSVNTPNNRHPRPDVDGVLWWEVQAYEPEAIPQEHVGWQGLCPMRVNVRAYI
jgi:hypothetical protein